MTARVRQRRSDVTREAILDAAERLFAADGVEPTPVTAVASDAGRAVGSLYHHFSDKAGLVDAVVGRILDDLEADVGTATDPAQWRGFDIPRIVSTYVDVALARDRERPGYKRVLAEVTLTDEPTRRRYREIRERLQDGLTRLFLDRRSSIGHRDPETAVPFAVDQLNAMLGARLDRANTPTQLEDAPDDRFCAEAVASIRAYLQIGDSGRTP